MTTAQPALANQAVDGPAHRPVLNRIINLPNFLTAAYLVVGGALLLRHGIWRDEAQAWLIARDSVWPWDVITNTAYEGHPPLWHFLLYVVTRFTSAPEAMQWLHLALAAGSVYLVARFAPFPARAKILFGFGYFTLFEYGIIARNYQLFLLLSLAFCVVWQQTLGSGRRRFIWLALVLAGLCLTHVIGVILAGALGLMLLLDVACTRDGWRSIARNPVRFGLALLIVAAGAWWSVKLLKPQPDNSFDSRWDFSMVPMHVQTTLNSLWDAYVPIPQWGDWHFWGTNFLSPGTFDGKSYLGAASPVSPWNTAAYRGVWLAGGALALMIVSWRAVVFFLISTLGLLAFEHLKFEGEVRHHGGLFVALVAAFWIAWVFRKAQPAVMWRRFLWAAPREAFIVLLMLQAVGAYVATYYAWRHPFSVAREAAAALRPQLTADDQLMGFYEPVTSTLAAYLPDRKFYYPEDDRWGTFAIWKDFRRSTRSDLQGAYDLAKKTGKPVIYISGGNLGPAPTPGFTLFGPRQAPASFLGGFPAGIVGNESYYFYRVMPPAPPAAPPTRPATRPNAP